MDQDPLNTRCSGVLAEIFGLKNEPGIGLVLHVLLVLWQLLHLLKPLLCLFQALFALFGDFLVVFIKVVLVGLYILHTSNPAFFT